MFYSYTPVISNGITYTFNTSYKANEETASTDTLSSMLNTSPTEEELEELRTQIILFGSVDNTYYAYVPDNYPLVEQSDKINLTQMEILPEETKTRLLAEGTWANAQKRIQSMNDLVYKPVEPEGMREYLFSMQTQIRELAALVKQLTPMVEAAYLSDTEDNTVSNILVSTSNTLNKLTTSQSELNAKFASAGLM